jgi:hypothetical protein
MGQKIRHGLLIKTTEDSLMIHGLVRQAIGTASGYVDKIVIKITRSGHAHLQHYNSELRFGCTDESPALSLPDNRGLHPLIFLPERDADYTRP